jgi:hypothetical protein
MDKLTIEGLKNVIRKYNEETQGVKLRKWSTLKKAELIEFVKKNIKVNKKESIPKKPDAKKLMKELEKRNVERGERQKFLQKLQKAKKLDTSKAEELLKDLEFRNVDRAERQELLKRLTTASKLTSKEKLTKEQENLFNFFKKVIEINKEVKKLEKDVDKLSKKYGKGTEADDDKIEKQIDALKDKINYPEQFLGGTAIPSLDLSESQLKSLIRANLNILDIGVINNLKLNLDVKISADLIERVKELVKLNKSLLQNLLEDMGNLDVLFGSTDMFSGYEFADEDEEQEAENFENDLLNISLENK